MSNYSEPTLLIAGTIGTDAIHVAHACGVAPLAKFEKADAEDKGFKAWDHCSTSKVEFAPVGFALLFVAMVLEILVLVAFALVLTGKSLEGVKRRAVQGLDIGAEFIGIISSISLLTTYGSQPSPIINIIGSCLVFAFNLYQEMKAE